jgi:hypothetical protein
VGKTVLSLSCLSHVCALCVCCYLSLGFGHPHKGIFPVEDCQISVNCAGIEAGIS